LNGHAFLGLNKLRMVMLNNNECIDKTFESKDQLLSLDQVLTQKCGYCGTDKPIEPYVCEIKKHLQESGKNLKVIIDGQKVLESILSGQKKFDSLLEGQKLFDKVLQGQQHQIELLETLLNQTNIEKSNYIAEIAQHLVRIEILESENKKKDEEIKRLTELTENVISDQ